MLLFSLIISFLITSFTRFLGTRFLNSKSTLEPTILIGVQLGGQRGWPPHGRLTRSRGPRHLLPGYCLYSVCLCPCLLGCAVEVIVNLCLSKICNQMQFKIDLFKILNCCHCFKVNQKLHTTVRRIVGLKYTYLCFTVQARTEVTLGFLLRYELNISPVKNKIFIFLDRNFPAKSKSGQSGFIQLVSL